MTDRVYALCNECDNYNPKTGECNVATPDEQQMYANRGWCGWGQINGKRLEIHIKHDFCGREIAKGLRKKVQKLSRLEDEFCP